MKRIDEHDEFLLSRLVDGDLPADEAALLRERMKVDAELRAAFEALVRVDQVLSGRRGDQPEIDWGQFRRQILDAVYAEAVKPNIIRMPRWAWIGAPLAAAAAIALAVISTSDFRSKYVTPADMPMARLVQPSESDTNVKIASIPRTPETGALVVRFNRPSFEQKNTAGAVRVSYTQSADLAKAVRQRDTERRSRPAGHMYVAEIKQRSAPQINVADLPPLL